MKFAKVFGALIFTLRGICPGEYNNDCKHLHVTVNYYRQTLSIESVYNNNYFNMNHQKNLMDLDSQ